jgi:hypothetical protein
VQEISRAPAKNCCTYWRTEIPSVGYLLRAILVSAATAVLTSAVVFLFSYLAFPLGGIKVAGARMFSASEVWNAVPQRASLLTLNAAALERKVESNPWVEGAEVTKDWNSGIVTVQVEERRAILDGEVDGRRVILAEDGERLPGVGGADLRSVELDEDQLREILEFAKVMQGSEVRLDSIDEVGPGGIEATVEGRRVVFSGDVEPGQARALEDIMAEHTEARIFDLRSPRRVVVGGAEG